MGEMEVMVQIAMLPPMVARKEGMEVTAEGEAEAEALQLEAQEAQEVLGAPQEASLAMQLRQRLRQETARLGEWEA